MKDTSLIQRLIYWLGPISLSIAFIIGRWGVWQYFPNPLVYTDSVKYLEVAERIASGSVPSFHNIGAGYPIFIWIIKSIGGHLFSVVIVQQLLSLLAAMLLFWVFRKNTATAIASLIVGILHLLSDNVIKYEIWIFPDSLITSLNLIWCGLAFHAVTKNSTSSSIFAGIVGAFSIIIRSSSVFFIPLTIILSAWFVLKKNQKPAIWGMVAIIIPLAVISFYNSQWSTGNRFSFLTYDRFDQYSISSKPENSNKPLTDEELAFVENLIKQLPDSSELKKYYFTWNLNELTKSVLNCRMGRKAETTKNATLLCCSGDMFSLKCDSLYGNRNTIKDGQLLNQYLETHKSKYKVLKYFAAYHANLNMTYGQTYYSTIHHAYETTVSQTNQHIYSVLPKKRISEVKTYIYGDNLNETTKEEFAYLFQKLVSNPVFKAYDLMNNRLLKPMYRSWLWPLIALLTSLVILGKLSLSKLKNSESFGLLLTSVLCFGASLVFAVFTNPLPRYSFETEFCYTLISTLGFASLMAWPNRDSQSEKHI